MRRTFVLFIAMAATVPFLFGAASSSAGPTHLSLANRFAPSGTVTMDPATRHISLSLARKLGAGLPAFHPSPTGTSGCPDSSATNVRANQECTNQSAPGYLGRGQSQNETAV